MKTISRNIIAAVLQLISYIIWVVGRLVLDLLITHDRVGEIVAESFRVIIPTVSSIMQFISFYILIHVFWHYGLNIERTLEKQEKREEELRKKKYEEYLKDNLSIDYGALPSKAKGALAIRDDGSIVVINQKRGTEVPGKAYDPSKPLDYKSSIASPSAINAAPFFSGKDGVKV